MFPTQNSLPEQIRGQSIDLLNKHLAAAIDLHAQLKQAHWNVRGPAFIAIHELFDRISVEAEAMSDVIAERVGGLGGVAKGTLQVAAERSFLPPYLLGVGQEEMHLGAIAAALAAFGTSARGAIGEATAFGDVDTADLFTEVSRTTDKQLWFIESHNVPA
ncbi:DNA starvation/stationary phase protection protein Dps [Sphingobium sp. D43FB]|uniref:DNA starvation/stationary phase protection protein Dps n=1 Tax=Sphingobium sp. D43FB TaxID=2017595 RepID=UPI000BB58908|nr:DNA starvation/stationary phase protection protein Dps [Sphingobium sp. D43FB]PBN43586.1 DNA starvation/stationary phase protection protein Dps [Sphingobium sp. D43FB]